MPAGQHNQGFEDLRNTLTEVLRIVQYRWRLALLGLTLVGAAAFIASQWVPREYAATTLFERRDDAVLQNLVASNSPYGFEHLKTTLQLDIVGSRALARGVVRAGLAPAERFPGDGALSDDERRALDALVGRYRLKPAAGLIQSSPNLDTIQLQCGANDPHVARDVVIALRDNYVAESRERISQILGRTRDFFATEVARLQDQVAASDTRLHGGFEDYPGLDPTDVIALGSRLEVLRTQRNAAAQRRAELENQIAARQEFLVSAAALYSGQTHVSTSQPGVVTPTGNPALERAIEETRTQVYELMTARRMTAEHPDVRRLNERLAALEELRVSLAKPDPNAVAAPVAVTDLNPTQREWQAQKLRIDLEVEALQRQLVLAKQDETDIGDRVDQFAGLFDKATAQGEEFQKLREKRATTVSELALWQGHLARLERVLSAETGDRGTTFTLIEEPKDAGLPMQPRLVTVLLVCLGLAVAAAALCVAAAELFDRSFRSVSQVTRSLGVPVLECIGVIRTPRQKRRDFVRRLVWTPVIALLVLAFVGAGALAYASLTRPDAYASARQHMDRALRAIGVAAAPSDRNPA